MGGMVAITAQDADVTGTWVFDVVTDGGGGTPTLTLEQEGEVLTGHYSSANLGESDLTGTVKGAEINFSFDAEPARAGDVGHLRGDRRWRFDERYGRPGWTRQRYVYRRTPVTKLFAGRPVSEHTRDDNISGRGPDSDRAEGRRDRGVSGPLGADTGAGGRHPHG